jgi:hypothetical protein
MQVLFGVLLIDPVVVFVPAQGVIVVDEVVRGDLDRQGVDGGQWLDLESGKG